MISLADLVAVYLHPGTESPVSMLELGLCAKQMGEKMVIVCPEGYVRRGNIQVVCDRFGIRMVGSLEEMVGWVRGTFDRWGKDTG